jgi:competence protein ComEA
MSLDKFINKHLVLLGAAMLIILLIFSVVLGQMESQRNPIVVTTATWASSTSVPTLTPPRVDVSGCVVSPGVYELAPHAIVKDAMQAAGGPTDQADLDRINLAREVQHQEKIIIPCKSTPPPVVTEDPVPAAPTVATCEGINLNAATQAELETLPGIGPAKAHAIIAYREEHGPFQSVEELTNVPGIGQATLETLRPLICVPGEE